MTWELHYFGDPAFTRDRPTLPTPVALPCNFCCEPIRSGERGVVLQTVDVAVDPATIPPGGEVVIALPIEKARAQGLLSVALHIECLYRETMGSVGHQLKQCPCHGGRFDDPPGMTRRQAARAAFRLACELAYSGGKLSEGRLLAAQAVLAGKSARSEAGEPN